MQPNVYSQAARPGPEPQRRTPIPRAAKGPASQSPWRFFLLVFLTAFCGAAHAQIKPLAAQWHYSGNNVDGASYYLGVHANNTGGYDWIYAVLPTNNREYIAAGYTTTAAKGDFRPVVMKLDNMGRVVWIRTIQTALNLAGQPQALAGLNGFLALTKTSNGYAASGYASSYSPSPGRVTSLVAEFDEGGNYVGVGGILHEAKMFEPAGSGSSKCRSVAWSDAAGQQQLITSGEAVSAGNGYGLAHVTAFDYNTWAVAGSWLGGGTEDDPVYDINKTSYGGNNLMKVIADPANGDVYACGWRAVENDVDNQTFLITNKTGSTVPVIKRDKEMWLIKFDAGLVPQFEKTYNKADLNYPASLTYTETGPFSARSIGTSTLGSQTGATAYLRESANKDERAYDLEFTADGELVLVGIVNAISLYGYLDGNGGTAVQDYEGVTDVSRNYHFDEYLDGDGYLLKLQKGTGDVIYSKNVSHFSSKDFYVQVYQNAQGNFIVGASTADYNTPYGTVDYYDALVLETTDGPKAGHLWRRNFHASAGDNEEYGMCLFSMAETADGGVIIGGDNDGADTDEDDEIYYFEGSRTDGKLVLYGHKENDNFSITKFAPYCAPKQYYQRDNYTVSAPLEIINSNMSISGKINVPTGKTLRIDNAVLTFSSSDHLYDYFEFPSTILPGNFGGIDVKPGGRLEIVNSTLQGFQSCNGSRYMWDGITVKGNPGLAQNATNQGTLYMDRATIRDARIGVEAAAATRRPIYELNTAAGYDPSYDHYKCITGSSRYAWDASNGGGMVDARNSSFYDCRFGVNYQRYPTPGLGLAATTPGSYSGCRFESTAGGMADVCMYTDGHGGNLPARTHFGAASIDKLYLSDNVFTSATTFDPYIRPTGVLAAESGMRIIRSCGYGYDDFCNQCAGQPGPGNSFTNLYQGVLGVYNPGYSALPLVVTRNTFKDNVRGIAVSNSTGSTHITSNTIQVPNLVPPTAADPYGTGIIVTGSYGYEIAYNTIDRTNPTGGNYGTQGIVIKNGHANDERVRLNILDHLAAGCVALQTNGNTDNSIPALSSGLLFQCNDFLSGMRRDIERVAYDASDNSVVNPEIRQYQRVLSNGNSQAAGAGNRFYNPCYGANKLEAPVFSVPGSSPQVVTYFANTAQPPYDPSGCVRTGRYLVTVNPAAAISDHLTQACGTRCFGEARMALNTIDEVLDKPTLSEDVRAGLQHERSLLVSQVAGEYGIRYQYDSAARLLEQYGFYARALPYYLQAGLAADARRVWTALPKETTADALYARMTEAALTLYGKGAGWEGASADDRKVFAAQASTSTASGSMAMGLVDFWGLSAFRWPVARPDSAAATQPGGPAVPLSGSGTTAAAPRCALYPTPTAGDFTVVTSTAAELRLMNAEGKTLLVAQLRAGETRMSVPKGLAPGLYYACLQGATGEKQVFKVLYRP